MDELRLPPKTRSVLEDFIKKLNQIYKDGLVSVVLYGSASSGEFAEKHSNINLMVVLADTTLPSLARARGLVNSARFNSIQPMFFTEDYITSSLDIFPIEFLDIAENHAVLYGKDVVKDLKIDTRNLRFQCEQELKSKLLNVKKQYLLAKNKNEIERLLFKTFTSTLHILRNVLRLKGRAAPYLKEEILCQIGKEFGVDTRVFDEILWAKKKSMSLSYKNIDALLAGLVGELESVVAAVDKM